MSTELDAIEQDIRATRARLAANLSVLTSSQSIDELKSTVKSEAIEATDDLMDRVKSSGLDMLRRGFEDVKDKAMQNPAAVAALGAGIGWRLWKHPPIATALLGYGLFSLLRGPEKDPIQNAVRDAGGKIEDAAADAYDAASRTASDMRDKAAQAARDVRDTAASLSDEARNKAASLVTGAKETIAAVQDKAASVTSDARRSASAIASEARDTASSLVSEGREVSEDLLLQSRQTGHELMDGLGDRARQIRSDPQSQLLLGVAGVAVAAAVGIAVNRYRGRYD